MLLLKISSLPCIIFCSYSHLDFIVELGNPNRSQEHRRNGILGQQQCKYSANGTEQSSGEASCGTHMPGFQVQPTRNLAGGSPRAAEQDTGCCKFSGMKRLPSWWKPVYIFTCLELFISKLENAKAFASI